MKLRIFDSISQWWQWLDKLQQQPTVHTVITDEQHVCINCSTAFTGRFCPQCGLRANRERMTAKNVIQGFLDIWGFGSRNMLRSIHELFWRPGYMMRDYLDGHQPLYYPPFEMLIIMTLIFSLVCSLRNIEPSADDAFVYGNVFQRYGAPPLVISIFAVIDKVLLWLHAHPAYSAITLDIFYIVASWIVFLRRMSFFEVFLSQIYISCQMQIVGTLWVLFTGSEAYYNVPPFAVPLLIGLPLLCYDYAQLYRLHLWPTLWRTVLTLLLTLLLILAVGALPILFVKIF